MTREERIEAACIRAYGESAWTEAYRDEDRAIRRGIAAAHFDGGYPELAAGTHWIAPNKITKLMATEAWDAFASNSMSEAYAAMRDAYLNASTHQDGETSR